MAFPIVERAVGDTTPIFFEWPNASATIVAKVAIGQATSFVPCNGQVSFARQEGAKFIYQLAYSASDRPSGDGIARYELTEGSLRDYLTLNVERTQSPTVSPAPIPTNLIEARIQEIDAILASGASSVTVDGTTTAYNLRELRAERLELLKKLESGNTGGTRRRPYVMKPKLG